MNLNLPLSLVVFFLVISSASAQLISIEKVNCRVSESDIKTIKKIARFEKDLYNNLFNTHKNDSLRISVTIMSAADYKSVQQKSSGLHKTWGFYSPQLDHSYVLRNSEYLKTVIHEMSHCLLRHNLRNPPRWLNEGIAEFCGSMLIEDNQVSFAANPYRIQEVKNIVLASPIKLESFMGILDSGWADLDKRSNLYSISYAVVYFLIKKNPSTLKRMLLRMQEGENAKNAIEFSYGGFYKFENDFNAFYRDTLIKPI